jgi:hypothetical protein
MKSLDVFTKWQISICKLNDSGGISIFIILIGRKNYIFEKYNYLQNSNITSMACGKYTFNFNRVLDLKYSCMCQIMDQN